VNKKRDGVPNSRNNRDGYQHDGDKSIFRLIPVWPSVTWR
jgi:hypothetical protein